MFKILLVVIGFGIGVLSTHGIFSEMYAFKNLAYEDTQATRNQNQETEILPQKVVALDPDVGDVYGLIQEIDLNNNRLTVAYPSRYQPNVIEYVQLEISKETKVDEATRSVDTNGHMFFWSTQEKNIGDLKRGDQVYVEYKRSTNMLQAVFIERVQ